MSTDPLSLSPRAVLLQLLSEADGAGLDLIDRANARCCASGRLAFGQRNVYPTLRELEREGLAEGYEGDGTPERGGRPRRYYVLTARGHNAAEEQRAWVRRVFGL